ncbi:hypothetical protein KI387_018097, partial [Taxus chinensis]
NNSDICHFDVHNVAERDILRTEGDPASAGYTIKEAAALVRSVVPGQRAIALQLIAAVLDKALVNLHESKVQNDATLDMHGRNKSVDWQAIWAYALGPEPGLVLTLRGTLASVVKDPSLASRAFFGSERSTLVYHFGAAFRAVLQRYYQRVQRKGLRIFGGIWGRESKGFQIRLMAAIWVRLSITLKAPPSVSKRDDLQPLFGGFPVGPFQI